MTEIKYKQTIFLLVTPVNMNTLL